MFNQLLVSGRERRKTHTRWTVIISLLSQMGVLAVLILIPLIYTQALPTAMLATMLVAPPPPPPPPPPPKNVVVVKPPPSFIQHNRMVAPKVIPKRVAIVTEPQTPTVDTNSIYTLPGSTMPEIANGTGPAPPAPPPPVVTKTINVVSTVQNAKLLHQVLPQYPPIAKQARIQGSVVLHAIIAKDGSIAQLQYVSGPALLVQAAEAAVKQWKYQPTLLNGQPVQVDTVITVNFNLGG